MNKLNEMYVSIRISFIIKKKKLKILNKNISVITPCIYEKVTNAQIFYSLHKRLLDVLNASCNRIIIYAQCTYRYKG